MGFKKGFLNLYCFDRSPFYKLNILVFFKAVLSAIANTAPTTP